VQSPERRDPEKLISALSDRFLLGCSISEEVRRKLLESSGTSLPLTDATIRKIILSLVQSPVYQVT